MAHAVLRNTPNYHSFKSSSFFMLRAPLRTLGSIRHYSTPVPSISSFSYIDDDFLSAVSQREIAKYLDSLGPFPSYSQILNPQHFFQNELLLKYVEKDPHPVSLRQLAGYGKVLTKQKIVNSANFVRIELPIRLAQRIRDLQTLPFGVVNNLHLAQVYESYYRLFNVLRRWPKITTLDDNEAFCSVLSNLLTDHMSNLPHLMMGALEVSILDSLNQNDLDQFMSLMIRSRISRRVIVEEHLSLTDNYKTAPYSSKPPDYIGGIFHPCNAAEHFRHVAEVVKASLTDVYPDKEKMPDLEIDGDLDTKFPFMVPHLHYLFGEILRNSYEATIKTHGDRTSRKLPAIKITIINGKKQVILRISDRGGGLSHDKLSNIYSFGKSPQRARESLAKFHRIPGLRLQTNFKLAGSEDDESHQDALLLRTSLGEQQQNDQKSSTLQTLISRPHQYRLGLGLPMSRIYADYWNGDLQMNSLEGYGCDTSLTLSKLGFHSNTVLLDRAY